MFAVVRSYFAFTVFLLYAVPLIFLLLNTAIYIL